MLENKISNDAKKKDAEIASKLRNIRKSKGLLQKSVASQIGMKTYTLQSIETGKRKLQFDELETLCDFYGVSVEEIIRDEENQRGDKIFIHAFNSLSEESKKDVLDYISFQQQKNVIYKK